MNSNPFKVSVIIPAYNASLYIEETLDSLMRQSVKPFEIIVVDDGSKDNTADLVAKYHPRVKLITQPNQGPAIARNRGIYESCGDYIAFIDADDLWHVEKLAKAELCFATNPSLEMISTGFKMGNETQGWASAQTRKVFNPSENFFEQLYRRSFIATSSVVIKRNALNLIGGFNPNFFGPEDHDLWLRASLSNINYYFIEEELLLYRVHNMSITADPSKNYRDTKNVFKRYRWNAGFNLYLKRITILNITTALKLFQLKKYFKASLFIFRTAINILTSPYEYYVY